MCRDCGSMDYGETNARTFSVREPWRCTYGMLRSGVVYHANKLSLTVLPILKKYLKLTNVKHFCQFVKLTF